MAGALGLQAFLQLGGARSYGGLGVTACTEHALDTLRGRNTDDGSLKHQSYTYQHVDRRRRQLQASSWRRRMKHVQVVVVAYGRVLASWLLGACSICLVLM
jgi:hypothetical protein